MAQTTIGVSKDVAERLKALKLIKEESYNSVVIRLLDNAAPQADVVG